MRSLFRRRMKRALRGKCHRRETTRDSTFYRYRCSVSTHSSRHFPLAIGLVATAASDQPFTAHSIRSFADCAKRHAARNRRIKVNFARLTRNQCSTPAPTLTRADPRLSPRPSIPPIRPPRSRSPLPSPPRMVSGNSAPSAPGHKLYAFYRAA